MNAVRRRFIGGPWDGEHRRILALERIHVPQPPPPLHLGGPEFGHGPEIGHTVVYVRAQLATSMDAVEEVYVEERFYRAELHAQETQERRDQLSAEAIRRFDAEPDLRAFLEYPNLRASVWWCGDEYCNCTEAHVEGWLGAYDLDGNSVDWPVPGQLAFPYTGKGTMLDVVWRGRFYTDGEGDAGEDLAFLRRYLQEFAVDIEQRIRWPR